MGPPCSPPQQPILKPAMRGWRGTAEQTGPARRDRRTNGPARRDRRTNARLQSGAMNFDAVILAGGAARRMDGADKAQVTVGGARLLDRVLDAVRAAGRVIIVGPERPLASSWRRSRPPPIWTRERPRGGGPAAALGAGLEAVTAPTVVVLAVDLPFASSGMVARLLEALTSEVAAEGAIARDRSGRDQYLAGAYRAGSLRKRLDALGSAQGVSMRTVIGGMHLSRLDEDWGGEDCDTWEDVRAARQRVGGD